jgi:hypothetical protein
LEVQDNSLTSAEDMMDTDQIDPHDLDADQLDQLAWLVADAQDGYGDPVPVPVAA